MVRNTFPPPLFRPTRPVISEGEIFEFLDLIVIAENMMGDKVVRGLTAVQLKHGSANG